MLQFLESLFTITGATVVVVLIVVVILVGIMVWWNRKID
jgi:NADH:ubiquinone oxidoreductase subunit H